MLKQVVHIVTAGLRVNCISLSKTYIPIVFRFSKISLPLTFIQRSNHFTQFTACFLGFYINPDDGVTLFRNVDNLIFNRTESHP
jgi:hypothetical protein